ncbi:MAG: NAD(P)H-hydrate dehydratase [Verrucomicrobiota bacterium]
MPLPVLTVAQMRQWEQDSWNARRSPEDVIQRVGEAVAQTATRLTRPGDLVVLLVGKGNNGADARASLEHFNDRNLDLLDVRDPESDFSELESLLASNPTLIVDGLFGIGLDRPLSDAWIRFIERINESGSCVLSVDVPSGLDADTGRPRGAAIRAAATLAVGAPKSGLLSAAAVEYVGRLEVAEDVGLIPCPIESELEWITASDFAGWPPPRRVASHKGTFGHVALIAGSRGFHGAGVLAARGAQRARPGLVTLLPTEPAWPPAAAQLQAAMVHPWHPATFNPAPYTALVAGPGLAGPEISAETRAVVAGLWKTFPGPMLADASALEWLGETHPDAIRVITPHPGEAGKLLGTTAAAVQSDRLQALRSLSRRFGGCHVVLKGHQTLIGRAEGGVRVNSSGNSFLAQGGAGDLLAGYIGGLLAQPELQKDPTETIALGVWSHGAAADRLQATRPNWIIEDLAAQIGNLS